MNQFHKYSIGRNGVQVVTYENDPSLSLGGYRGGRSSDGKGSSQYYNANKEQTLRRRNRTIRELVTNNFRNNKCNFATLTIDPLKFPFTLRLLENISLSDREEQLMGIVDTANVEFHRFIRRVQKQHPQFNYVVVPEICINNGNRVHMHFHMLHDAIGIGDAELERLWGFGYVHTEKVYNVIGIGAYMTKGGDLEREDILFGRKGYFASKGLQKNKTARSWNTEEHHLFFDVADKLADRTPDNVFKTSNDFVGNVTYEQYSDVNNDELFSGKSKKSKAEERD